MPKPEEVTPPTCPDCIKEGDGHLHPWHPYAKYEVTPPMSAEMFYKVWAQKKMESTGCRVLWPDSDWWWEFAEAYAARRTMASDDYLGKVLVARYATPEEAAAAYREAALKWHGEFARLG